MNYLQQFQKGYLVLPPDLLFHFKDLFPSADEYVVWQFFFYQNTSNIEGLAPSQIAQACGKSISEINRSIEQLQEAGLLDFKTINLSGEIEMIFDASPALEKLDALLQSDTSLQEPQPARYDLKQLVADFEVELGRLLSPLEIEDLQKTLNDDLTSPDVVREALREAVFNNKTNWKYIQAILRNWRREGITTVAQVEAKRVEREGQQPRNISVSADFLEAMDYWKE
ncbi:MULTISPECIES: DnaD domain-containing protein [unclassified Streptococcus]|uniref:DnaD domain-containing protein n=1 Tax=unclassified Streptococcus TaxID=2608887 RepID=UPI001072D3FD|nr:MULTISPECIES: DnaD domain-containing protein [unclassified Streptococcus]MBF0786576.1 DnaD domain-containing protein [Streptococcus sp. 19428wC2_LYSM12]MCQ9210931.1 DnaD domain-containing protein [Streptococcus sp. B01]MCQ9214200.1 DnaD domain-containing protein [Streptococcus sp. O1]TFV06539.1 DnaD domain protein [Streptococcus sp. LYSM12]